MAADVPSRQQQILFARRPDGVLSPEHFVVGDGPVERPGPGELLCRTVLLSIDPANRAWMQARTYQEQLAEGQIMAAAGLCEVIVSNEPRIPVGSVVYGRPGWQEYSVLAASDVELVEVRGQLSHHLSVLGLTGMTAYFGLMSVGRAKAGETVLISAASGATGNVVGQLARLKGCRVVGITGSDEKNQRLVAELGFDAALNHRSPDFVQQLKSTCSDGVDVYFDNVGGPLLEHAIGLLRVHGRVVCCGVVSQYDTDSPAPGPRRVPGLLITKRLRMEGFLVYDFQSDFPRAIDEIAGWLDSGELLVLEEVHDGLEAAPEALVGLLRGDNVGKRLVRVGPDPARTSSRQRSVPQSPESAVRQELEDK